MRLRLKSVALMFFHCECKIVVLLKNTTLQRLHISAIPDLRLVAATFR
jgi:hypothetical protein